MAPLFFEYFGERDMISILAYLLNITSIVAISVMAFSGLDYIADGITIFTDPVVWGIRGFFVWASVVCSKFCIGMIFMLVYRKPV